MASDMIFVYFKESCVRFKKETTVLTDTGYQGLQEIHANSQLPKKKTTSYKK
jgi:hypothetical protein